MPKILYLIICLFVTTEVEGKSFYKSGLVKFFLFKICRCKPGPRELVAGLMKRYCPSNFVVNSTALHCNVMNLSYQPFQLAIAQGIVMFHGPLIRHLTSGKAPVSILVSEDNGKAQVESFFLFCTQLCFKRASLILPRVCFGWSPQRRTKFHPTRM